MEKGAAGERIGGLERALCFSFSGLKTALLYHLKKNPGLVDDPQGLADISASYQEAAFQALAGKVSTALSRVEVKAMACVGGVAKNRRLRGLLDDVAAGAGLPLYLAPMTYCTDNAVMIAAVVAEGGGMEVPSPYSVDVEPSLALA